MVKGMEVYQIINHFYKFKYNYFKIFMEWTQFLFLWSFSFTCIRKRQNNCKEGGGLQPINNKFYKNISKGIEK